jgi:ubiquinone/menaquinone biosynthesis C-methylase UbiE
MSLVLSYIFNPVETLREIRRIISPGGLLVLSSMRPDTDASGPFTRLMAKIEAMAPENLPQEWPKDLLLHSLRSFLNDAQALVDLEEAGTFDFFDPEKLEGLLDEAGWEIVRTIPSFGDPPQGYVVAAKVRETHG